MQELKAHGSRHGRRAHPTRKMNRGILTLRSTKGPWIPSGHKLTDLRVRAGWTCPTCTTRGMDEDDIVYMPELSSQNK